jgi:hypothetical protein
MSAALAILLFCGMATTIGMRLLRPLVETPHYTSDAMLREAACGFNATASQCVSVITGARTMASCVACNEG